MDPLKALEAAKALRRQRVKQIEEMETALYTWLEFAAASHHTSRRHALAVWRTVTTNPLHTPFFKKHAEALKQRLAAMLPAKTANAGGDTTGDAAGSGATTDDDDVVTMTKLQFLEQELAQLKAMLAAQASQGGGVPTAPSAPASTIITSPVAPTAATHSPASTAFAPSPPPVSAPASASVADEVAALAASMAPPAATPARTTTTPQTTTPARPSMVSLVQQASNIKLKPIGNKDRRMSVAHPGGLESILKSALDKKFAAPVDGDESDSDSSSTFSSPMTPPNRTARNRTLRRSMSAKAPRRQSLMAEAPESSSVPKAGITTAQVDDSPADNAPAAASDSNPMSRSMPPAIAGGRLPGGLLQSIRGFNKSKALRSSGGPAPPSTPSDVMSTPASRLTVGSPLGDNPFQTPQRPSFLADIQGFTKTRLKTVSAASDDVTAGSGSTPDKAPPAVPLKRGGAAGGGGGLMSALKGVTLRKTGRRLPGTVMPADKENM